MEKKMDNEMETVILLQKSIEQVIRLLLRFVCGCARFDWLPLKFRGLCLVDSAG